MSKIFKNQSALRIQLTCDQSIVGASVRRIYYEKPSGIEGYWAAIAGDTSDGTVYYDVVDTTILDEAGTWKFWVYIVFSDDREAYGEVFTQVISKIGYK